MHPQGLQCPAGTMARHPHDCLSTHPPPRPVLGRCEVSAPSKRASGEVSCQQQSPLGAWSGQHAAPRRWWAWPRSAGAGACEQRGHATPGCIWVARRAHPRLEGCRRCKIRTPAGLWAPAPVGSVHGRNTVPIGAVLQVRWRSAAAAQAPSLRLLLGGDGPEDAGCQGRHLPRAIFQQPVNQFGRSRA